MLVLFSFKNSAYFSGKQKFLKLRYLLNHSFTLFVRSFFITDGWFRSRVCSNRYFLLSQRIFLSFNIYSCHFLSMMFCYVFSKANIVTLAFLYTFVFVFGMMILNQIQDLKNQNWIIFLIVTRTLTAQLLITFQKLRSCKHTVLFVNTTLFVYLKHT